MAKASRRSATSVKTPDAPRRSSPYALATGFRQTRAGRAFSPWVSELGVPLHTPCDFSLSALAPLASQHPDNIADDSDCAVACAPQPPPASPRPFASIASASNPPTPRPPQAHAPSPEPREAPAARSTPSTPLPFASVANASCPPAPQSRAPSPELRDSCAISKEKYHASHRSKRRRRQARERAAEAAHATAVKLKAVARRRRAEASPIHAHAPAIGQGNAGRDAFSLSTLSSIVARTGYVTRRTELKHAGTHLATMEELLEEGFQYVAWDGRNPRPLVDSEGVVFAVLAGHPRDDNWEDAVRDATSRLEGVRRSCGLEGGEYAHRRGAYACLTSGISYGGGQQQPMNFENDPRVQRVIGEALRSESIRRIANFANGAFQMFAPRLHKYYFETLGQLRARDSALRVNFERNAFAACTLNLGPRTVTYSHLDGYNLPWGWCAVTALGRFNHKKGGHLVLWGPKMLIEVPAGSTVLIPSAILRHSNTLIGEDESRLSLTQYSAGGLFRWVECGFRSRREYNTIPGAVPLEETGDVRWKEGLQMLSTWQELTAQ